MIKKMFVLFGIMLMFVGCNGTATLPPVAVSIDKIKDENHRNYNTYTIFFSARNIEFLESELDKKNF